MNSLEKKMNCVLLSTFIRYYRYDICYIYHIYHIHQYVKKMKYPHEISVSLGKHVGLVKSLWEPARCAGCFSVMALVSSGEMVSSNGLAWWFGVFGGLDS